MIGFVLFVTLLISHLVAWLAGSYAKEQYLKNEKPIPNPSEGLGMKQKS